MIRLLPLLLMLLSPALASGQLLMVKAAPAPETTTNPSLEHPDVIWVAADGSVDETPTVLAGEIASYEILDDSLPGGWSFNTSTGQLTCADVGSSAIAGTIKIRAKNSAFVDIVSTPNEYAEIRQRYLIYTSTDTISTADTFPFIANTSGCLYTVSEPITVDGSWLAINGNVNYIGIYGGGNTITYDNGDTVIDNPGFETAGVSADLADGWDFSNAASAERFEGVYTSSQVAFNSTWSLHFDAQIGASETVENETEIELEPNTYYCLQTMMYMTGGSTNCKAYVQLVRQDEAETIEASNTVSTSGAMKLTSTKFLTDEVGGTYVLVAGADNPDSDADYEAYIDEISVTRYRAHAIHVRTVDDTTGGFPNHPDIDSYGTANGCTISDLVITQGADAGFECHAIRDRNTTGAIGTHISQVTTTTNGNDTSAVFGEFTTLCELYNNTFNSDSLYLSSRSTFTGEVINAVGGEICYNTFDGAPHCAIRGYSNGNPIVAHHNTIQIKSRYTNGFGILVVNDQGSQIYNNTIDNTDGYYGRGIFAENDDPDSTTIHNNHVTVEELPLNQDYGGPVDGGGYGIQLETAFDVDVLNNQVYAEANVTECAAFRSSDSGGTVTGNIFSAIRTDTDYAAASIKLQQHDTGSGLVLSDNELITNNIWLEARTCDQVLIDSHTLTITGDGSLAWPMSVTWPNIETGSVTDIEWRDSVFSDATAETVMAKDIVNDTTFAVDTHGDLFVSWTTTIEVEDAATDPLSGATVTIDDVSPAEVFSGTINGSGLATAVLIEFDTAGETTTSHNDHTVDVVSGELTGSDTFTADSVQTITVTAE